jgi:predicted PurR-regulated permease PerM
MSIGLATTFSLGLMVEKRIAEIASRWPEYKQSIRAKSGALMEWSDRLEKYQNEIRETFSGGVDRRTVTNAPGEEFDTRRTSQPSPAPIPVRIVPEEHSLLAALSNYGEGMIAPLVSALLVAAMLAFMLLHWEIVRDRMLLLMGASRPAVVDRAIEEAANRVSRVLIAQCSINGCFGAMTALGLWIIHLTLGGHSSLPMAIAAGILCGILRFVPYVGVWIGAGIFLLYTLAVYSSNVVFFAALAMFVILEIVTAQIAEPRWLGAQAGISPPGILISTVFWTWIWGPVGLLLATPLTVLLVVMAKHIPARRYVYILLADRHELGLSRRTSASA